MLFVGPIVHMQIVQCHDFIIQIFENLVKILIHLCTFILHPFHVSNHWWYRSVQVADFGLSKEEVFDGRKSGLKGTYGYMDPDYMSTYKFTKKSDIYSFGIILFELITAINAQQGLMEYINLVSFSWRFRFLTITILLFWLYIYRTLYFLPEYAAEGQTYLNHLQLTLTGCPSWVTTMRPWYELPIT